MNINSNKNNNKTFKRNKQHYMIVSQFLVIKMTLNRMRKCNRLQTTAESSLIRRKNEFSILMLVNGKKTHI